MKKLFAFALCAMLGLQVCQAQYTEKKSVVALGDFTGANGETLRNAFTSSLSKCRISVTVVNWNDVKNDSIMASTVDYIISGTAGNVSVSTTTLSSTTYYNSSLPFSLTMMDAHTSQVIDSRSTQRKSSMSNRDASVRDCLNLEGSVIEECNALIYKNCAIRVPIQVIQDMKKNRVQTIIIAGGSDIGICKELYFDVQLESEIAGKKFYKTVGEAKVKEVLSEELTLCEITKGHKEITKLLDDDMTIVLTSNTKSSFGEGARGIYNTIFH